MSNSGDDDNGGSGKVNPPQKSYYSENERKLNKLCDFGVHIPEPQYDEYCPKCKKVAESDFAWVYEEKDVAGVRGYISYEYSAFPHHCSNGHWWEPNSAKVYTEDQMKNRMVTRLDAGNPCAKPYPGYRDSASGRWVTTETDKEYFARHGWKGISLTREEYFGAESYNKALVAVAQAELLETRKKARQLTAYVKKVAATLKNKPKGAKGKKKKAAAKA